MKDILVEVPFVRVFLLLFDKTEKPYPFFRVFSQERWELPTFEVRYQEQVHPYSLAREFLSTHFEGIECQLEPKLSHYHNKYYVGDGTYLELFLAFNLTGIPLHLRFDSSIALGQWFTEEELNSEEMLDYNLILWRTFDGVDISEETSIFKHVEI